MMFQMGTVQSGQKASNANAEPALIANSTEGKFTLTAPVCRALGIKPGDYIQFISNIDAIDAAITSRDAGLVALCEENGIDINTPEGRNQILKTFGTWGIAKGIQVFDKLGNPATRPERLTAEEKKAYFEKNYDEIMAALRPILIERSGKAEDEVTEAELVELITSDDISVETERFEGSRAASTSNTTGVGAQCNFTDSNVWKTLKKDLVDPKSVNRQFAINLEAPKQVALHNGYETVEVTYFDLGEVEDKMPLIREKKA